MKPTPTHGGDLLQPQESLQRSVHRRRVCSIFAAVIDCNSVRRQTQAGVLPVCDKFLWRRGAALTALVKLQIARRKARKATQKTLGRDLVTVNQSSDAATTFAARIVSLTPHFNLRLHGHVGTRRKRGSQLLAYDHSPQAHGLARSQRNVRRVLAVQFCSCGVESRKASQTPGQAERSPLAAVGKTRLVIVGRLIAAGVATGHEQSFSYTPRGATVHIPLADCFSKCRCAAGPYMQVAG